MKRIIVSFALLLLPLQLIAQTYTYQPPEQINDGIKTADARDMNVNLDLIEEGIKKVSSGEYQKMDALLIAKNGKLVVEAYFNGFSRDQLHQTRSVTKSVAGLLTGIAIDRGDLPSINEEVFKYLPDHQSYRTKKHDTIEIKHLITMTSGLEWLESSVPYGSPENDETRMLDQADWLNYVLSKPVIHEPGTQWAYSGGVANLLAEVMKNATGMPLNQYAEKNLFSHLGIENYTWWSNSNTGRISASAGLSITPRSMLKLGLLYQKGGKWDGKQIVSADWIRQSTQMQVEGQQLGPFMVHYGYLFLVGDPLFEAPNLKGFYVASGNGGQVIWVIPKSDLIIVITGSNYDSELGQSQIIDIFMNHLWPALQ